MAHSLYQRDILSISDLNLVEINRIVELAQHIKQQQSTPWLNGKILANCFFEPSTRTRLSFASAMLRCGGQTLGFSDVATTSGSKGESLTDSMRVIGDYADVIVLRHPNEGAARVAAAATTTPVINGGDGSNQHPTQTLADLFSFAECQTTLTDLHVALVGDLKYGRTVHSLAQACALYNIRLFFVAPEHLFMPEHVCNILRRQGVKFSFHRSLSDVISKVDIIYMTRLQKERLLQTDDTWVNTSWRITPASLHHAKPNLKIFHPLPRTDEIDYRIDDTPYAYYFTQAKNAVYVRQALLSLLLQEEIPHV
jgi:aspartate carbamoyltransferase catalytic subunit